MKFLDNLQDSIYDIMGYLIPGYITLAIIYTSLNYSLTKNVFITPAQILIECLSSLSFDNLIFDIKLSAIQLIILSFSAYFIGHIINMFSRIFLEIFKDVFNNKINEFRYGNTYFKKLYDFVKDHHSANFEDYLICNNARSIVRTSKINSNIQKYIAKSNLYLVLTLFSFLFTLNFFSLIYISPNLAITFSFLLCSIASTYTFGYEYCRHKYLIDKESLFVLYREITKTDASNSKKVIYPL